MPTIAILFLVLIGLAAGAYLIWRDRTRQAQRRQWRDTLIRCQPQVAQANAEYAQLLDGSRYCNHRRLVLWQERWRSIASSVDIPYAALPLDPVLKRAVSLFQDSYQHAPMRVEQYNLTFCEQELAANQQLFDSIERNPLDPQQRAAIVHDEDHNLIVAGAGTGKTTTIAGKTAYLLQRLGVQPNEILLLAFTRKAAGEMAERVATRLNTRLDVKTFHSFGLEVIAAVEGRKPNLFLDGDATRVQSLINELFEKALIDPAYLRLVTDYFLYYLKPYRPPESFTSQGDYFQYLRAHDVQTLKSVVTGTYEDVRSLEEAEIANFLFLNGVEYRYEPDYRYNTADVAHRQYRPDFYLSEHDLYIEHFAIHRDGSVPDWFEGTDAADRRRHYQDGIAWKRDTHQRFGTKLIETYSYDKAEGELTSRLKQKLASHGVTLTPRPPDEVVRILRQSEEIPLLVALLSTFLNLFKANLHTLEELQTKAAQRSDLGRGTAFLKLFEPIYEAYEERLQSASQIDFSDMLCKAAGYIQSGAYHSRYRYILIDEFQDLSVGRYRLVRALLDQNPEQKLFCVGDDWQSIYRFTGSDLSLMLDFEDYFGFTRKTFLERTYRFNNQIAAFSEDFILKNPRQLRKRLQATQFSEEPAHQVLYKQRLEDEVPLTQALESIAQLSTPSVRSTVFVLGRYNFSAPKQLTSLRQQFPQLQIDFYTAHRSKGLEADYVIIDGLVTGRYGFPTEMTDDPVLQLVLTDPDGYPNSEERRLFYVALTRARHKVYLLSLKDRPSSFVREAAPQEDSSALCPRCKTGMLVQKKNRQNGSLFWGCSNFPHCRYTNSVAAAKVANLL